MVQTLLQKLGGAKLPKYVTELRDSSDSSKYIIDEALKALRAGAETTKGGRPRGGGGAGGKRILLWGGEEPAVEPFTGGGGKGTRSVTPEPGAEAEFAQLTDPQARRMASPGGRGKAGTGGRGDRPPIPLSPEPYPEIGAADRRVSGGASEIAPPDYAHALQLGHQALMEGYKDPATWKTAVRRYLDFNDSQLEYLWREITGAAERRGR